jgi:hypothetical protein
MTTTTYLLCFVAGLLGIALHIFAVKIPATKTRAIAANIKFSYSAYFQDDLAAILASFIALLVYVVCLKELLDYKPVIKPFITFGSVFVGFTGSSIIVAILGKASAKINAIVDVKTDVADQVEPTSEQPKV